MKNKGIRNYHMIKYQMRVLCPKYFSGKKGVISYPKTYEDTHTPIIAVT